MANSLKCVNRSVLFSLVGDEKCSVEGGRVSYKVAVFSRRARSARTNKDNYKYTTSALTSCVLPGVRGKR